MFAVTDDFSWVTGAHAYKFGLEVRRDHIVLAYINRPNGNFTFNGQYTGNAAADFLLGFPQQYRQATGDPNMDGSTLSTSLYAQDEWRAVAARHAERRRCATRSRRRSSRRTTS